MKTRIYWVFAAIVALAITLQSCNKEKMSEAGTNSAQPNEEVSLRSSGGWDRDPNEIIKEVTSFREDIGRWIQGDYTGTRMDAREALELMEVTWNYHVASPGKAFARYEFVMDSIPLTDNPAVWGERKMAEVYLALKDRLSAHFGSVAGSDKAYQFIEIGFSEREAVSTIYIMANIGDGEIQEPLSLPLGDIRWAANAGVVGAPILQCSGGASEVIGQAVNANLGFFLQNLPPSPISSGNPNVNTTVFIVSPVRNAQTNFFGTNFPLANSLPSLFIEKLFGTVTSPTNPALLNPVNIGNLPTDYLATGQYKVHADPAQSPDFPDEACFSFQKLGAYCISNRQVGDSYVPRVNQILGTAGIFSRRLIATYVGNRADNINNPAGNFFLHEHPTYHFYALVLPLLEREEISPQDM